MDFKDLNDILSEVVDRMNFKETTSEGDVILVILEYTMLWAVVTKISDEDDSGIRDVYIKLLSIPPLEMKLNITNDQLDGKEHLVIENNKAYIKALSFDDIYSGETKVLYSGSDKDLQKDNIIVSGKKSIN
jgi:hypothetical protein